MDRPTALSGVLDEEGARRRIDAAADHDLGGPIGQHQTERALVCDLPLRPGRGRERIGAQRPEAALQVRNEPGEHLLALDRPAGYLAEARHGRREIGREFGRRPVGVDADPDHDSEHWQRPVDGQPTSERADAPSVALEPFG
jgi:hypothetical protein